MSTSAEFTTDNFVAEVLQNESAVLVDFWAPWCGPCRAVGPVIENVASEFDGRAKVGKLNIDENPEVAEQFEVTSIPAVLLFKGGEIVERLIGIRPQERYELALNAASENSVAEVNVDGTTSEETCGT